MKKLFLSAIFLLGSSGIKAESFDIFCQFAGKEISEHVEGQGPIFTVDQDDVSVRIEVQQAEDICTLSCAVVAGDESQMATLVINDQNAAEIASEQFVLSIKNFTK